MPRIRHSAATSAAAGCGPKCAARSSASTATATTSTSSRPRSGATTRRSSSSWRRDFGVAIALALALVYMLMAAQFERFVDPLVVMLAVPAALVGVVPTLLLTGTTLNIQSVMGLVMLIGIVVNNAIVLVDTVNLLRRERGLPPAEAVVEAGRLRPWRRAAADRDRPATV